MSRTHAHVPYHVRVVRRDISVVPFHECGSLDSCDLPELVPGWSFTRSRCRWEFLYTGRGVCSCWMCHCHHRPEERRATVRTELRAVARFWNCGEQDAGYAM